MSLIAEYRDTEASLKELQERLEKLSSDDRLQKELEFEQRLRALMGEFNKSLVDINQILNPLQTGNQAAAKKQTRQRKIKIYRNPKNGEEIRTKGGNHAKLKEWKAAYGSDTVESWVVK